MTTTKSGMTDLLWVMAQGHACPIANERYAWAVAEITGLRQKVAQLIDEASYADLRASGGITGDVSQPQEATETLAEAPPQCSAGNGVVNGLGWMQTEADRGDGSSEFSGFEAETPFGTFYAIEIHGDAFTVEYDLTKIGEADTPDEAKRIGQRDFEQRIRTALVPDEPQGALDQEELAAVIRTGITMGRPAFAIAGEVLFTLSRPQSNTP